MRSTTAGVDTESAEHTAGTPEIVGGDRSSCATTEPLIAEPAKLTLAFHARSAIDLVGLVRDTTTSVTSGGQLILGDLALVVAALVMTSTIGGLLATAVAAVSALLTVLARAAGVSLLALVLIGVVLYAVLHH